MINFDSTIIPCGKIGIAVSGGKDSMALLYKLALDTPSTASSFVALHIDHGIRGEASVNDSELVINFCKKNNITIYVKTLNLSEYRALGDSLEQAAREVRYREFANFIEDGTCDYIVTAHHKSDNAETILMRILRGTGTLGLKGIPKIRDHFVRPMLDVERADIDKYINQHHIPYAIDASNFDPKYSRNFLRNEVIPLIKSRYPELDNALLRLSAIAHEDEKYFASIIENKISISNNAIIIPKEDLLVPSLGARLIREGFRKLGITADIEKRHCQLIYDLASTSSTNTIDMPYGIKVAIEYDNIALYRPIPPLQIEVPFALGPTTFGENTLIANKITNLTLNKSTLCCNLDALTSSTIRTRREGDFFKKFGGGTKSLSDYFVDIKLPARLRDNTLLITKGSEVLVVLGIEISEKVKVNCDDNIVLLELS